MHQESLLALLLPPPSPAIDDGKGGFYALAVEQRQQAWRDLLLRDYMALRLRTLGVSWYPASVPLRGSGVSWAREEDTLRTK